MKILPLLEMNLIPLPGEVSSIVISREDCRALFLEMERSREDTFGIYYDHYANVNGYGSRVRPVEIVHRPPWEGERLWLRTVSVFRLLQARENVWGKEKRHPLARVEEKNRWDGFWLGVSLRRDFLRYLVLSGCRAEAERYRGQDRFDLFEVVKWLELSDPEKFYLLNLTDPARVYLFLINTLRVRSAALKQKGSIVGGWFLN